MSSFAINAPAAAAADDPHQLLLQAIAPHQQGRIDEAASACRRILAQQPNNFDAMHLLGVVALQRGQLKLALHWFDIALQAAEGGLPMRTFNGDFLRGWRQSPESSGNCARKSSSAAISCFAI